MSSRHQRRKRAKEKRIYLTQCAEDKRFYEERDALIRRNLRSPIERNYYASVPSCVALCGQPRSRGGRGTADTFYRSSDKTRIAKNIKDNVIVR